MKANQRFTLVAIALSCISCAGTTVALVSLDQPVDSPAVGVHQVGELRPSLAGVPEQISPPRPQPVSRPSRLSFVSPDATDIELPDESIVVAAAAKTWDVEVKQQPVTSTKPQRSFSKARSRSAKKRRKRRYTLKQRLAEISPAALRRVVAKFDKAKVAWPPAKIAFVGIKDEKALELYSQSKDGAWKFVYRYKVLAASGRSGPKLQRGDKQVPEGIYRISYLNPNSAYHVSLRVNYPNAFDRKMAKKDGRKDLGGDIMIHGKNVSAGCLAVGDRSAEELFVLAAEVGRKNIDVVIAPTDFRKKENAKKLKASGWVPGLYTEIQTAMTDFKKPEEPSLLTLLGF